MLLQGHEITLKEFFLKSKGKKKKKKRSCPRVGLKKTRLTVTVQFKILIKVLELLQ